MNRYIEAYLRMYLWPSSANMLEYMAAAYAIAPWGRGEDSDLYNDGEEPGVDPTEDDPD